MPEFQGRWGLALKTSPRDSDKLRWDGSGGLGRLPIASGQLYRCLVQTCGVKIVQPTEQKPHWKKPKLGPASLTLPEKKLHHGCPKANPKHHQADASLYEPVGSSPGTKN